MDAQFDAFVGFAGDAQKFDAVAEFFGVFDVAAVEFADAFEVAGGEVHRRTECQRAHDGDFMACVVAFDVEGRICFGIAQCLRFFQYVGKRAAFFAHFGEDEVAGAVDDTGDAADAVGGEAFAQGFDNRDAARHCRLKLHHDVFFFRQREDFVAVFGEQFFVGGNDVFAVFNGFQHRIFGDAGTAEQFDDDIDVFTRDQFERVFDKGCGRADLAGFFFAQVAYGTDAHFASQTAADFRRIVLQHGSRTAADRT